MQLTGLVDRYVIGRDGNVVQVDFARPPDPPAPRFPGAGALRGTDRSGTELVMAVCDRARRLS